MVINRLETNISKQWKSSKCSDEKLDFSKILSLQRVINFDKFRNAYNLIRRT